MTAQALRWWHTLRHLRPVQFYARAWFRLHRPRVDLRPAPPQRHPVALLLPGPAAPSSLLRPWVFRFIGEEHDLDAHGWDDTALPRLWRYNLHYFDDLVAADAPARAAWHAALLDRWIAQNPPGQGTGWEPYPCSLRIVNWVRWSLSGQALTRSQQDSLAAQARWLCGRLEHHLLGNHLWANAKALVFAGAFFVGDEAGRWRATGLRLLRREIVEQVLPDGGHFERSPMYHAIVLNDLLDLCALAQALPDALPPADVEAWRSTAGRMLRWLHAMSHPDGDIALFNDAAFDIAPAPASLHTRAAALGIVQEHEDAPGAPIVDLDASGYVRMQCGPAVLLADVGAIGPDYIPGHAHADTLSFELSVYGQRVVVDSGTSRYDASAERLRQRATAAHNTVEIDGADSSEVWSSFRVARRARPFAKRVETAPQGLCLECSHDGYHRLPGRPVHRRRWQLSAQGLRIADRVEGRCDTAVARYHFHSDVAITQADALGGSLRLRDGRQIRWRCAGATAVLGDSSYHPAFNVALPNRCLELRLQGPACDFELLWP